MSLNILRIQQNSGFHFGDFIINLPIAKIKLANCQNKTCQFFPLYSIHCVYLFMLDMQYSSQGTIALSPSPSLSLSLSLPLSFSLPLTIISNINAIDCTVFPSPISSASIQFCLVYQLNSSQLRSSN